MTKWRVAKEKWRGTERLIIRRFDGTRNVRYPVNEYKAFRDNLAEMEAFARRINARTQLADAVKTLYSPYCDEKTLESYREYLEAQMTSPERVTALYGYVRRYFVDWFVAHVGPNPVDWHKEHKTKWATYLRSKQAPASRYTKDEIVREANRFMAWLHDRRPDIPLLEFKPLTSAVLKTEEATRILNGEVRQKYYIGAPDWATILANAPESIKGMVLLGYKYGLRRSEILGLQLEDVYSLNLRLKRQLVKINQWGILKGREARSIPHWDSSPGECYKLVESIVVMSPDTFTELFSELTAGLKKKNKIAHVYHLHDLRHTWITRMVRLHAIRDVQLAAGHKDIRTTMGYLHDDRAEDKPFKPTG